MGNNKSKPSRDCEGLLVWQHGFTIQNVETQASCHKSVLLLSCVLSCRAVMSFVTRQEKLGFLTGEKTDVMCACA